MSAWLKLARRFSRPLPKVGQTPADVVYTENKLRLLRYRPRPEGVRFRTPVVLVPSLINRHYVLDLMPGRSFAEFLVAQGHEVYAIDWGTPGDEDRYLDFDAICDRYLGRALRRAAAGAPRGQVHVLGYCLGGVLSLIHAAVRPEAVASLALLATPVQFKDDGQLSIWTRTDTFDVEALVEGCGNVPWQLMQSAFHLLRPTQSLTKLLGLIERGDDDEFLDGFLAVETWGNDNVSFPGACYRRYIEELYRKDALLEGGFTLSGRPVRLSEVRCPTLAVSFANDHIVPWQSAAVVVERIGAEDREHLKLAGGHVGAVVSRAAARSLWPKLSGFWAERDR